MSGRAGVEKTKERANRVLSHREAPGTITVEGLDGGKTLSLPKISLSVPGD